MVLYAFKSNKLEHLTSLEVKEIMEKGNKLFEIMLRTPEAKQYLEWNPKLKEAIIKW